MPANDTSTWWYVLNGDRKGPVSDPDLHNLLISGTLNAKSLVWKAGMGEWQPAGEVSDLGPILALQPPPVPPTQQRSAPRSWRSLRRHLGSTVALVVGCLALVGGLASIAGGGNGSALIGGLVMILGAFAYRSAKKRKLGEVQPNIKRRVVEYGLLLLIVLIIVSQNNFMHRFVTDPVPNLLIPAWAVLAYLIVIAIPNKLSQSKTNGRTRARDDEPETA